jgi:PAS domain S-box-containing protein
MAGNEKIISTNGDTRELKITLQELEKVQAFQKAILENAGAMIIATDDKGTIRLFNPEAAKKLGYTEEEILNKKTPLLFHDKQEIRLKRQQLIDEFGEKEFNDFDVLVEKARRNLYAEERFNYINKSGEIFPVWLSITQLVNGQKAPTGFLGIAFDISEKIKAEQKFKKTEFLFLQLLNNYPDGTISIIDRDLHFVYTGGELHKLLNADIQMLIGNEIFPFFPKPLRRIIFPMLESIFQDKIFITGFELPYQIANGTYIMDAFPLIEEDGSVNNIGVIIKNISMLKQAEKNLREDLKIERELNELKSRFVSMASHEFRTPLSTVLSSAYLIEKYTSQEDQPKREKHVQRIVSSVNMLTDILNDFLSLGKIESGKLEAKFTEFNLRDLVAETVDELKNTLKKEQQIKYTFEGEPSAVLDPSLVKHILINLISNASKFSSDSSTIKIKACRSNGQIMLAVKDNGIGIPKEDQKHLTDRFFRARNAQDIQGTGLGLHIVLRYVQMMDGEFRFESEVDNGTEFTVTFKT